MKLRHLSLRVSTRPEVVGFVQRFLRKSARSHATTGRREIALTFDDGPHPEWTPRVLDALDHANLKATFFVVGRAMRAFPDIVKEARQRGHEIGTHLDSHERGVVFDDRAFEDELARVKGDFDRILGEPLRWLRFPYGERGKQEPRAILQRHALTAIHWTYSSHDTRAKNAGEIVSRVEAGLRAGAIVLFHDALFDEKTAPPPYVAARHATIEALPRVGELIATRDLRAVTLTELFRHS